MPRAAGVGAGTILLRRQAGRAGQEAVLHVLTRHRSPVSTWWPLWGSIRLGAKRLRAFGTAFLRLSTIASSRLARTLPYQPAAKDRGPEGQCGALRGDFRYEYEGN